MIKNLRLKRLCFKRLILVSSLVVLSSIASNAQTYSPYLYYTYDGINPLADSMGHGNLNPNYYSSYYTIGTNTTGQGVGKYMSLYPNSTIIKGADFAPDSGLTVEFLLRPGYQFDGADILWSQNGCFSLRMGFPYIKFYTTTFTAGNVQVDDVFNIDLIDVGRRSYGYYIDGSWHHIVLKMNAKTGVKQIWVDGQLPAGFEKILGTNCHFNAGTYNAIYINSTNANLNYRGDLDELAFYKYDLHQNVIYNHYLNFQNHLHYSFLYSTTPPPTASPVTAGIDLNEFQAGYPNAGPGYMEQMANFPAARFRPNHALMPNGTLLNFAYLGGYKYGTVADKQAVTNSVEIQKTLFKNFNFAIQVASASTEWAQFGDTNKFSGAWIKLANDNPTIPTTISTAWPHVIPSMAGYTSGETYTTCQCLPATSYLRNSSGQFIDVNGVPTQTKELAPNAPLDSIYLDGKALKFCLSKLFSILTRPLNYILDESENLQILNTNNGGPPADPWVTADKNASGLDWNTYYGNRYARFCKAYRDSAMTLSQLANTKYQLYETEGHDFYRPKYSESRSIQTPVNGMNYPIASMYTQFPWNWRYNASAWNGWQWYVESRVNEIAAGDKYCAPAVAAGWDNVEDNNIRPAQWMGFCKALAMAGAEFFYPSFFVTGVGTASLQNPSNYAWQVVIPAYAQAITSRYEDLFKNGYLMDGDVPLVSSNPTGPKGYSFKAGDQRKLVVIRKSNTVNKYAITGTLQPSSNQMGSAELEGTAQITLDTQTLKFKVRRQGSTYIYDNTNLSSPVFYMLDGWHEYSHPYNWTRNFEFEAELFDNNSASIAIKTQVPAGTIVGDYTNFTSYIAINSSTVQAKYNFVVRGSNPATYYLWVRARSKGASGQIDTYMDANLTGTIGCITDTNWTWYRINSASNLPITFTNLSVNNHELGVKVSNNQIEIDKLILTTTSGAVYGNTVTTCNPVIAAITASGPVTFCTNDSVVLAANSAVSAYLWSTGATTQSIVVKNAATYTVTITNINGSTSVSTPVTVTVNALPIAVISSTKSTICPNETLVLTSSTGAFYLWSTGATTSTISINTIGSFIVIVTNSNGCSKTSAPLVITAGTCAPVATITVGGPLTFCQGGSVLLTASGGNSYSWSNGNTTAAITATISGVYVVTATNLYGLTATASVSVLVNNNPIAIISSNAGDSLCSGYSLSLTVSLNASYLWTGGATTQIKIVTTPGTYNVTVSSTNTCTTSASFTVRQGACIPNALITTNGPTSFCDGDSVLLSATPGMVSYLWSNGNTNQSFTQKNTATFTVTVTNNLGFSAVSNPVSVNKFNLPTTFITASADSLCPGDTVLLSGYYQTVYLWSTGQTTRTIKVSSPGTYTIIETNIKGCTKVSNPYIIYPKVCIPPASAVITTNGNANFCDGGNVVLSANSSNTYLWSTGQSTQNISATTTNNYVVTITDLYGQTASASIHVEVYPLPGVNITSNAGTQLCPGTSMILTSNSTTGNLWSDGTAAQNITAVVPGSYTLTITSNYGCTSSGIFTITPKYCPPVVSITPDGPTTFCNGGSVTLAANSSNAYLWSTGSTSQNVSVNLTGDYTVTVSDSYAQTASATIHVEVNVSPVAGITSSGGAAICAGDSLTLSATNSSLYLWSNGLTIQSIMVSNLGVYTVTVSNLTGCTASSSFQVTQGSCLPDSTIAISGLTTFCAGDSCILSGANGLTSYLWSNGSTSQFVIVKNTGTFSLTVTNASGNTATSVAISVIVNDNPGAVISSSKDSICAGQSAILSCLPASNYLWSTGETAQSINASTAGLFTLTVTNGFGCSNVSAPFQLKAGSCVPAIATITASGPTTFCNGNTITLSANLSNSYLWSTGATTQNITVSITGNYTLTVTDGNNQSASTFIAIQVNNNPTANISSNAGDSLCPGTFLILTSTAGFGYLWSTGQTTQSIAITNSGSYTVTLFNSLGCSSTSTFIAKQGVCSQPDASVSPSGNVSICKGTSVQLSALSGYSYIWSTGETTQSIWVNTTGSFTVTVTNWFGLSAISNPVTIIILSKPNPLITTNGVMSICPPGTITLTANASASYLWSTGETTQSIIVSQPASYVVTITNAKGCTASSAPAVVTLGNCISSCVVPYNLSTPLTSITSTSAKLKWSQGIGATSVNYTCTKISNSNSITGTVANGNLFVVLNALLPNTKYKWSVRANCSGTYSLNSDTVFFKTLIAGARIISDGQSAEVLIYPNPTHDVLYLAFDDNIETTYTVRVMDIAGKLISVQNYSSFIGSNTINVDVEKIATGMYFIEIDNQQELKRMKFVKGE